MIKKIYYITFTLIVGFLSYIIRKNPNIILFASEGENEYTGNAKYLFLYLKNNTKYEIYFLTEDKKLLSNSKYFKKLYSISSIKLLLMAKYLASGGGIKSFFPLYFTFGKLNFINLWHGDTYKKLGYENKKYKDKKSYFSFLIYKFNQKTNKLVTTGNRFNKNTFEKTFLCNNVKITGLARYDIFFDGYEYMDSLKVKNDFVKKYDKIFFYAPTWRDNTSIKPFTELFLNKLNKYLNKQNYIFLIKMHPLTKDRVDTKEYSNIIDITDKKYDTQELLKYSDCIVVDYSSISIDFYLTDKPIIFYPYDKEKYYNIDREMYFEYKDMSIKETTTRKTDKLLDIIINIDKISKNKQYLYKYKKYKDFWHENQNGGYCKRILQEIKGVK